MNLNVISCDEKIIFNFRFWYLQLRFVIDLLPLPWLINCKAMYVAFGFTDSQPGLMGVIIVMKFILAPLNTVSVRSFFIFMDCRLFGKFLITFFFADLVAGILINRKFPKIRVPGGSIRRKTWSRWIDEARVGENAKRQSGLSFLRSVVLELVSRASSSSRTSCCIRKSRVDSCVCLFFSDFFIVRISIKNVPWKISSRYIFELDSRLHKVIFLQRKPHLCPWLWKNRGVTKVTRFYLPQ